MRVLAAYVAFLFVLLAVALGSKSLVWFVLAAIGLSFTALWVFSQTGGALFTLMVLYLFAGGIMCVLAYFCSFSWSPLRLVGGWSSLLLIPLLGGVAGNFRFGGAGSLESGLCWCDAALLPFLGLLVILVVVWLTGVMLMGGYGALRLFS